MREAESVLMYNVSYDDYDLNVAAPPATPNSTEFLMVGGKLKDYSQELAVRSGTVNQSQSINCV